MEDSAFYNRSLIQPVRSIVVIEAIPVVDHSVIAKLLINCWSAEYALRLTPLEPESDYLDQSVKWTFPQAYYSCLFSFRAVLAVMGDTETRSEAGFCGEVRKLTEEEFYPDGFITDQPGTTWFDAMSYFRITSKSTPLTISGDQVGAFHPVLVDTVDQILAYHEEFIIERMGVTEYRSMLDKMPGFIDRPRDRFKTLTARSISELLFS